ncbi:myelin protein zero-like protein 1 [Rhinophrynus dorsalis]
MSVARYGRSWLGLGVAVLFLVHHAEAMEIYVPPELLVENGTQARLPCTFKSTEIISSGITVEWNFQPESGTKPESIFHYSGGKGYTSPLFKDRITWAGDFNKRDASVKVDKMQFKDNGTFYCKVVNPPDAFGPSGEIKLSVVERVHHAEAMEIYVPPVLRVENGTQARLPCTFKSTEVIGSGIAVQWKYQPESGTKSQKIFHYSGGKGYTSPLFKDRITWAGDLNKRDASIKVDKMQFKDNGTFYCKVVNPPDAFGPSGEIKLSVVERGNLPVSNVPYWVGIICAVIGGLLLIAIIVFVIFICKKKKSRKNYSGCSTTDSLMSPVKQPPRKSPSDTEALVNHVPPGSVQGPVIYAQLDHSGKASDQINKSETVVYADIRRIC